MIIVHFKNTTTFFKKNYVIILTMKEGRRGKWLSHFLLALWFSSMALAGFFLPYFTDNISFFKIKALHIDGLESIPPQVIVEEVKKLKNNWLFINKNILMSNINKNTGNAVKDIEITRIFSKNGVELKLSVKERKPVFSVINNEVKIFFDEDGVMFQSPYINYHTPTIYTYSVELINKNFAIMKDLIKLLDSSGTLTDVYATELSTIAYFKGGTKLILPPLFLIDGGLLKHVAKLLKDYNIDMYKEIEISKEGLVIIRGGKGNEVNNVPRHRYQ